MRPIFSRELEFKAVHIQCLDNDGIAIENAYGSGFIRREGGRHFIYTCWHLVTGYDMNCVRVGNKLPNRKKIKVVLTNVQKSSNHFVTISGCQSIEIPLYHESERSNHFYPRWCQDKQDVPQLELNEIGIRVPLWRDTIKIELPDSVILTDFHLIDDEHCYLESPEIGNKVFIVGFPYGYSSHGLDHPTPVILSRSVASSSINERLSEVLLDGPGAPGMSGGPVFVETSTGLMLSGIYTGTIYPSRKNGLDDRGVSLGIHCNLLWTWNVDPLVPYDP